MLVRVLHATSDGAEDEAGAAGLSAGTSCDAEVELVAPVGVGVPRVLVGRTLRAGELVQGTGGAAGPEQFLVSLSCTWHRHLLAGLSGR